MFNSTVDAKTVVLVFCLVLFVWPNILLFISFIVCSIHFRPYLPALLWSHTHWVVSAEVDPGFRQSQASLIWRELEEEESVFASGLRRRAASGEEGAAPRGYRGDTSRRLSHHPEDSGAPYLLLATVAAMFALFVNMFYSLLFKTPWSWAGLGLDQDSTRPKEWLDQDSTGSKLGPQ